MNSDRRDTPLGPMPDQAATRVVNLQAPTTPPPAVSSLRLVQPRTRQNWRTFLNAVRENCSDDELRGRFYLDELPRLFIAQVRVQACTGDKRTDEANAQRLEAIWLK